MASIVKTKAGKWRAQIFVKGIRDSGSFPTKSAARQWASTRESELRSSLSDQEPMRLCPEPIRLPEQHVYVDSTLETLTHADIVLSAIRTDRMCGVYFLMQGDEIVYVGQSRDIYSRISHHLRNITCDKITAIPCPEEKLNSLELLYIRKFSPRYNVMGKVAMTDDEKAA